MWKQKTGISIGDQYSVPTAEVVKLVKRIGFDAISPVWTADSQLEPIVKAANQCGLYIQSLHAPFLKAADMWSRDEALCAPARSELLSALDACARYHIPILVVHPWIGFDYAFDPEALNFSNFEKVVAFAEARGIKIAFENTEGEEYLFALMEHFQNRDTVGFCWDSGHEMCYNHSRDLLARYGDRLLLTHLNDNLGISRFDGTTFWTDDLHLLPFDGISDWKDNIDRLKSSRRLDILNFELSIHSKPGRHENDIYGQMSLELYFTEAYKRACRLACPYSA